jgi:hypothetical protein
MVRVRELSVEQFVVAFCVNAALSILGILIFSFWRRKQRDFFAPRATLTDELSEEPHHEDTKSLTPVWKDGLFTWIWDTIRHLISPLFICFTSLS